MLSKRKKGVPPLNPLKSEKWFAYYKERFGHHNGDRGNNLETGVEDDDKRKAGVKEGKDLNAERRKLLSSIRGSQYWATCSMKSDNSNSIVLPVAYKTPASTGKPSDLDQSQYSSKSGGNRKVDLFPRNLVPLRSQLQDPQRHREPDIQSRLTSTTLLSDPSAIRSTAATNTSGKLAAIQGGVGPTVRRPGAAALQARSSHEKFFANSVTGADQSPPVREEVCAGASPLVMESGKITSQYKDAGGRLNFPVTSHPQVKLGKTKSLEFIYGPGSVAGAAMARPSCSEETSSETSDFSLDDARSKRHVPMADIGRGVPRDYGSSCSSSGSMSPLSLQSRFLDMRLQQNVDQSRRDHHQFEYPRNAPALKKSCTTHGSSTAVQAGLVGLYNEGNTCYLNSCLQCLAHTLPLASAVLGPYSDQIQKNGGRSRYGVPEREWASPADLLTYAFHHIVRDLWGKPPYSVASANIFLQCVQAFAPQFAGSFQHDAQEVLRAILDGLHEALNRVKVATPYRDLYVELKPEVELADLTWKYHKSCHDSIIHGIFCGQLQSTIECSVCHRKSHCFDPFMDLSLPLPKSSTASPLNSRESFRNSMHRQRVTLQDCLNEFGAPEQLEGSNIYYCPNCKAPRTSTKKLSLFRLPPVLVLHIKRFYGVERNSYTKDETPVYYPLKGLDLSNLMGSKARKMQGHVYDLYAVCCHMGSMGCGHYTAQCKNCDNNAWYCFNDSSVQPVQDAAVLTSSAYILFYEQRVL